ncbi:hypothetical protein OR1_00419 [Geobacter sp. OR-1]|uniref:hypothetical protein n=1 Tax=Geobacter sp. OR-1 TaxID=1266765 RepID=UPI0005439B4B|nr:hypothetical protein [Geobacter sp. OR-1]GAM08148.1 hypothetical protein OR1_00419 [Geobacter sp. OR-1]
MRKHKLLLLFYILIVIAVGVIGYVSVLYWQGGASNYEPPKQPAVSPQERVQSDLQNLSQAVDAYFIKNMEYPQKLELLIPEFIDRVGNDPLSGKTYLYNLDETGGIGRYRISVPDPKLYNAKELYIEDGKLFQK